MKKFLALISCVVPFGAAVADPIVIDPNTTPNSNVMDGLTVASDNYARVVSGAGLSLGAGGLSAGALYVGKDSTNPETPTGELFVETTASNPYSIVSDGNISITSLLEVLNGYALGIGAKSQGTTISLVNIGAINANGWLTMQNIGTLGTGNISSNANLGISANAMNVTGTIHSTGGNTTLDVVNALSITNDFIANGNAETNVSAGTLFARNIQNISGSMIIESGGDITSTGSVENSGTLMRITGADMGVAGTMKNDANGGTMNLVLDSLEVDGGSLSAASFVNKGNLSLDVAGETKLAFGFDLSGMNAANTFVLKTGTLDLGGGADSLSQVFENNHLANFELVVRDGVISANNITNGTNTNSATNMTLTAGANGITASTIQNRGQTLTVSTLEDTAGNITISNVGGTSVYGASGSTTNIFADGTLSATGAVSNAGTMLLDGNIIEMTNTSNTGNGQLTIVAQTDPTGRVHMSGGVSNSGGTTKINAREIAVDDVVSTTGGTTIIYGSDSTGGGVVVGGINTNGGVTNLDALIGGATITGNLLVSNGAFNVGQNTYNLNVGGGTQIGGNLTFSGTDATTGGDVNVANSGVNRFTITSAGQINIGGDVVATDSSIARSATLAANVIEIGGDVTTGGMGNIAFGNASTSTTQTTLDVTGDVVANIGGTVEMYSGATQLNSLSGNGLFLLHGDSVTATNGDINVANGIYFDGVTGLTRGVIISDTDEITLKTNTGNVVVNGGASIKNGTLNIISGDDATLSGLVVADTTNGVLNVVAENDVLFNNEITTTNGGTVTAMGEIVQTTAITNGTNGTVSLGANDTVSVNTTGIVKNAGTLDVRATDITMATLQSTGGTTTATATDELQIATVDVSGGDVTLNGASIGGDTMNLGGGTTKLASSTISIDDEIVVSGGNISQGGTIGTLILQNGGTVQTQDLTVSNGALLVDGNNVEYNITNNVTFANGINVTSGASTINAKSFAITAVNGGITNAGTLALNITDDLSLGIITNTGALSAKTTSGSIMATSLTNNVGLATFTADEMTFDDTLNAGGILRQNYTGALGVGDVNIVSNNHTLTAGNLITDGITQTSGTMLIKSSDVTVGNRGINATNLRIQANPSNDWLDVDVGGSVSGGVQFVGLEHMNIGHDYTFDDNSMIHAVILPNPGVTIDSTTYNYWSTVSLADDNTLGQITNATDGNAAPLISVGGRFINAATNSGSELSGTELVAPQIGIDIFDMVDNGTAIWLLRADSSEGLAELANKIRNLNVNFCNNDGSLCFKYFEPSIAESGTSADETQTNLPAYLSVRDVDNDGVTDSIYIVFDSRFGGPVEVFKIQPIVDRVPDHTAGEHAAAGALDEMIAGQLQDKGFNNRTPIESIPVVFAGTNLETLANEVYDRMEQYVISPDGTALARISRLVQPSEIEVLAGNIAMNEHITFRDFEDRMVDEFIWNRHRSLNKLWVDADYGLFYQNISDGKHASGDRFSITAGYDRQHSSTLIFGLTGRVSHTSSDDADVIDLSYISGQTITGRTSFDVTDTDIGLGAYMMKILGTKMRVYGNGFFDLHLLDISREQNFVSSISGSGSAFSLISEWGLLHDWLNQYIVGNAYARVGYNFGFSATEKSAGSEYMRLKSDGYMILTPGYSLTVQKRIYPTSWFQVRPYASAGVEYDVLGVPDYAQFKFGPAKSYTRYELDIDPLWANIGGGLELLSSRGFQLGLDYRYQYNNDMHFHKFKLSGSYRF